jgi:hypothetical protein
MLAESGRPRSRAATDCPMLLDAPVALSSGPFVQLVPKVNCPVC